MSPDYIAANYPRLVAEHARAYIDEIGAERHLKKLIKIAERNAVFVSGCE